MIKFILGVLALKYIVKIVLTIIGLLMLLGVCIYVIKNS